MEGDEPSPLIHPGEILRDEFLAHYGLSASAFAGRLGLPANSITRLVNGTQSVTAQMAVLLAEALGTSPEFWLNLQRKYDLDQVRDTVSPERLKKARILHDELLERQA